MDIRKYREWLLDGIECCKDNAVVFGGISGGHKWQIRAEALEVALREFDKVCSEGGEFLCV